MEQGELGFVPKVWGLHVVNPVGWAHREPSVVGVWGCLMLAAPLGCLL